MIQSIKYHEAWLSLSLWAHLCVYSHVLFPPNKQLYWFYSFPSLCGNSFLSSQWARALSLVPGGLVARIQGSHCLGLTSVSGRELKSCFEPLQSKAAVSDFLWPMDCSWIGLPFPPPGDLSDPGIKLTSLVLAGGSSPLSHLRILRHSMGND